MNKIQLGMFLEQNKDRLTAEDFSIAEKALENASSKKVVRVLSKQTKSPVVNTFLATFFGFVGGDSFYLGWIGVGIGRIITTIISIALYMVSLFLLPTIPAFEISIGESVFEVTAQILQYVGLGISALYSLIYIIILALNIKKSALVAKLKNAQILNIQHLLIPGIVEEKWNIG